MVKRKNDDTHFACEIAEIMIAAAERNEKSCEVVISVNVT